MDVDALIGIMRDNCYTLEMGYNGDKWRIAVFDKDLELLTDRNIKNGALIKPKIATAIWSIVEELS